MKAKLLGWVSLAVLIFTALWLIFLIADMASAGPLHTFEQILAHTDKLSVLFYATYVNVTLLTLCAVAWMALLCQERNLCYIIAKSLSEKELNHG